MSENENQAKRLREMMRLLVRKLGVLERGEASCCNITISQCYAIVEIGRAGKMSVVDLAECLKLDKSTVSRSVDNLVNQSIITRETDSSDRRFMVLCLTEQGESIYREIERRMEEYFCKIIAELPQSKCEQVIESISLVLDAMQDSKCC